MPSNTLPENPLRAGLVAERTPDPAVMVIFGASGDLARRKLIPALYNLARQHLLPPGFTVLGYARTPYSDDEFREVARKGVLDHGDVELQEEIWESFAEGLFYHTGGYDDLDSFRHLAARLQELDRAHNTHGNRLFYLATPPSVYAPVTTGLGACGLAHSAQGRSVGPGSVGPGSGGPGSRPPDPGPSDPGPLKPRGWTRIVVEKPFGHDLASARALNDHLLRIFDEGQVYRIDHYLGKETVQNILVFRFANGIFEPIWNRNYVDHVQITVAESIGVEGRGGYYDRSGALRDMVQNHMLQLVSLTAMEPPVAFDAKAVRDQKVNLLRSIHPLEPAQVDKWVVRAQYTAGVVSGRRMAAYLEEEGVPDTSTTETYVTWKLEIDNWRWNGVPFYLRTGKALPKKVSEIAVFFRAAPHLLFNADSQARHLARNVLALRIQPNEGISLKFSAKQPGPSVDLQPVNMDFSYGSSFGMVPPDAYERLLLDAMLGDGTLFTRRDEVEEAWDRVSRVLEGWRTQEAEAAERGRPLRLPTYEAGTWGPAEATELLARDGQRWRRL